ncbi:MAG: hypothetical protein ACJA2G_002672 [Cognaticolwellia sp.]|jgi:hypothetical protein
MKIAKFSRGKGKFLLFGVLIYAILFVILMVIRGDIFPDNATTTLWFKELRTNNNFLTSYLASSLDSLIFFIFIGVAAILISVKDPSDEVLFEKINYIFPQTQRDTALTNYIQEEISSLACIATEAKRSITIKELSPSEDCIKLDVKGRSHIKNIFNNHDFVSESMKFSIQADPITFSDVWAEMLEASITCDVATPVSKNQQLDGTIVLNEDKQSYTKSLPVTLGPHKNALYTTHAWFWQNLSKHFKFNASRFTQKAIYHVKNDLDIPVIISIKSNKLQITVSEKIINKIKEVLANSNLSQTDENELSSMLSPNNNKGELTIKHHTIKPDEDLSIAFDNVIPSDTIIFSFSLSAAAAAANKIK